MSISDEAVEAAQVVAVEAFERGELLDVFAVMDYTRQALEAAAPYMLAGLRELVEEMERQPPSEIAAVPGMAALIRSTVGELLTPPPYGGQA